MAASPSAAPRTRRRLFGALFVLTGLLAGLGIAEGALRTGLIFPVRQIIRGNEIREIDGVPIWEPTPEQEHLECAQRHPERTRLLFFGNSITNGSGVEFNESFTWLLEDRLNKARPQPGFCVMNFAVPAFRFAQKYAMARETVPKFRPAVVLYQDWDLEWDGTGCAPETGEIPYPREYSKLGGAVYGIMGLRLREDGFPGIRGVPNLLNAQLFLHSRLYEYLTLAIGEPAPTKTGCLPDSDRKLREQSLRKVFELSRSVGARPVIYIAADLSYPLNDTHEREREKENSVFELGRASGVSVYALRNLLSEQDNTQIRLDNWHFNPTGHRVLAEKFERIALDAVDGAPPTYALPPTAAGR